MNERIILLLVCYGFDVETKGGADYAGVLSIDLQNNCGFTRIVQATAKG